MRNAMGFHNHMFLGKDSVSLRAVTHCHAALAVCAVSSYLIGVK